MNRTHPRTGPGGRGPNALVVLLLLAVATVPTSCGGSGPALQVDGISYTKDDLLAITPDRQPRLVELTALALGYARGAVDSVGEPLLRRQEDDSLLARFRASLVLDRAGVGDDVLRAQYETDPQYELVVRHMVALASPNAPDSVQKAARAKAERALKRLNSGESMAKVAAEMSEEPGASRSGGLLKPGRKGSWVPPFWRAANSLQVGHHTGVVRTQYGFHVIELEKRTVVPFEEVRSDVVLQAGAMIGGMQDAWSSWRDSVAATVAVDTAAVGRWRRFPGPSAETAPPEGSSPLPDTLALAWIGEDGSGAPPGAGSAGRLSAGDFARAVAALPENRWRTVVSGPVTETLGELRDEVVRRRALAEARKRNLRLTSAEKDEIARAWASQVATWAATFGFKEGASAAQAKQEALSALSASGQNARLARDDVKPYGPLFRSAYPVRGLPAETGGSGAS